MVRYTNGLLPLTEPNEQDIEMVRFITWMMEVRVACCSEPPGNNKVLIVFFDGRVRGNPGSIGSGSVVVEYDRGADQCRPM